MSSSCGSVPGPGKEKNKRKSSSEESSSNSGKASTLFSSKRGRPEGNSAHPVHELFSFNKETNESSCLITPCTKKVTGQKHAGNLMKHLKSHHRDVYQTVSEKAKVLPISTNHTKTKTTVLNGVEMSGAALLLHCIRLVTQHGLSFKSLDYSAFQDIVQPLIRQIPANEQPTISSRAIPEKIPSFANLVRQEIAKEIEGKMVSLQVDGCTKNYRYFIGINVQYIVDGQVQCRTLAVEELHDRSSAANIKATIAFVFKKFGLTSSQVVSFTSDTGANYVLAGRLLAREGEDDEEEDAAGNDNALQLGDWSESVDLLQGDFSLQSIKCAEHTLQSGIGDVVKKDAGLQEMLGALRKLANFLKNETIALQLRKAGLPLPVVGCTTRWGYDVDMAKSVMRLRNFVERTLKCTAKEKKDHFLTDEQWERVGDFLNVFRPLRRATDKLQAKQMALGDFYAIWTEAKMALEKKKADGSDLAARLITAMEERAKPVAYKRPGAPERLPPLFHYPSFNAALLLDPRFVAILSPEQVGDGKAYLVELWMRRLSLNPSAESPKTEADIRSDESDVDAALLQRPSSSSNRRRRVSCSSSEDEGATIFAAFMEQQNTARLSQAHHASGTSAKAQARARLRAMLDEYDRVVEPMGADENVIKYWESKKLIWPELYELAMIVLAIPATQVSVERLFSSLKFILRPQRYNLTSLHVDDVVLLHVNPDLVRKVAMERLRGSSLSPSSSSSPDS